MISTLNYTNAGFFYLDINILTSTSFWVGLIVFSIISYLLGSLNTAQILSRIWKQDIGKVASHNYGATNASRVYGKKGFFIVFSFDLIKTIALGLILYGIVILISDAFSSVIVVESLFAAMSLSLVFVLVGHCYPIYFNFKGGKGTACGFGLLILINWIFAIIAICFFFWMIKVLRQIGTASVVATLFAGLLLLFQPFFGEGVPQSLIFNWSYSWLIWISSSFIISLIVYKHLTNLKNWQNDYQAVGIKRQLKKDCR